MKDKLNKHNIHFMEYDIKKAIERAKFLLSSNQEAPESITKGVIEYIFPGLIDTEDDKMIKAIIGYIDHGQHYGVSNKDMIAWLEKQMLINNLIPKFKIGDLIIKRSNTKCPVNSPMDNTICKVVDILDGHYILETEEGKMQESFKWQDYYVLVQPIGSNEPKWLYRLEYKDDSCGLWYNGNGKWCFEEGIGSLDDSCTAKSLPMDYDKRYKQDGRNWYSSCSNKNDLLHWFSKKDVKKLLDKGFVFTRYLATEYHDYNKETVFIKETSISREEIDFFKLMESQEADEVNGDDYGIDGLWHAARILEKTLGKVKGYQSDDGILEHKAAITAVKKIRQKSY